MPTTKKTTTKAKSPRPKKSTAKKVIEGAGEVMGHVAEDVQAGAKAVAKVAKKAVKKVKKAVVGTNSTGKKKASAPKKAAARKS
jgi:hypothetical protein